MSEKPSQSSPAASAQGACHCGRIRYRVVFPTGRAAHCHCEDCRSTHGAAMVTWSTVARERFALLSGAESLRTYESHPGYFWQFCGNCGSPCFAAAAEDPGEV